MPLGRSLKRKLRGLTREELDAWLHPQKGRKRATGWVEWARFYGQLLNVDDVAPKKLGTEALSRLLKRYAELRRMGEPVRVPRAPTDEEPKPTGFVWNEALLQKLEQLHAVLKRTVPVLLADPPQPSQLLGKASHLVQLNSHELPLTDVDVLAAFRRSSRVGSHSDQRLNLLLLFARAGIPFRRCDGLLAHDDRCGRIVGGLSRDKFCSRECFWSKYKRERGFRASRVQAVQAYRERRKKGEPRRKPGPARPGKRSKTEE